MNEEDDWEIFVGPSANKCKVKFGGKIVKNVQRIRVEVCAGGLSRVHLDLVGVGNVKVEPHEVILPTALERNSKWD